MRFLLLLVWLIPLTSTGQTDALHPRSIVSIEELPELREKVQRAPFRAMLDHKIAHVLEKQEVQSSRAYDPYADGDLMVQQAFLYLLTGEEKWATACWSSAERVLADEEILKNPISRGLTRARLLKNLALSYDFCYAAWNPEQRQEVNDQLYETMFSVNANMGYSANYSIESNWMGVRFGSVILASFVWDPDENNDRRTAEKPLQWDAGKRLQDHLEKQIFANGWNGESMSYHIYGWTFVGPALLSMQQNLSSFSLQNFAPETVNTLHGLMTSTVAIKHRAIRGVNADLSDDDMMFATGGVLAMGFSLYPEEQHAALKWMHDYLIHPEEYAHYTDETLFYSILYYPEALKPQNPAEIGWLTYHDPEQGIVIRRNRFRDENDIVTTYNAKQTGIRGHAGPDANTFRIIGLGVPWVIGGGRTGNTAGQSNLFPSEEATNKKDRKTLGTLHDFQFFENGAYAIGSGSALGTQDHQRIMYTSFDEQSGAEAVVVIADRSANGRRWRINTPEFNQVEETENGYILSAPNASTLRVKYLPASHERKLEKGILRYGGDTQTHNLGIWYQGEGYANSRYIDLFCDKDITAVITLQKDGQDHPEVTLQSEDEVVVGSLKIRLPEFATP
jgi:hypothetical protein